MHLLYEAHLLHHYQVFSSFMKVVMLYALLKQVREEGCQRRYYEGREITNVIIMFPSDAKRRKFKNVLF